MSNTPTLETERLILRKFTENDLEALYQIYRDPDVNRFLPWFPLQSMDEARKFLKTATHPFTRSHRPMPTPSA